MNNAIIEKLKKILSLAGNAAASEGEVQNAMAMAQKLAAENNLDLGQIMENGTEQERAEAIQTDRIDVEMRANHKSPEHAYILYTIRKCFDVETILCGNKIALVGEKTDVQLAQFCFKFLEGKFSRLMHKFIREVRGRSGYGTAAEQQNFYSGLAEGIVSVNKVIQKEAAAVASTALVLVNKEALVKARMAQEFPKLRSIQSKNKGDDPQARQQGFAQGKQIKLSQQLA